MAPIGPAVDTRQALSETASSSGMAGTLGGGKSRVDKRCQGSSGFLSGATLLPVWNYLRQSDVPKFHSVLGQSSAQGIRSPLSKLREPHRGRPIGQEQLHVRWCVRSSSSRSFWHSHDAKILFRLQFYSYRPQSVGAFLSLYQFWRTSHVYDCPFSLRF